MALQAKHLLLVAIVLLVLLPARAHAFGAGNIASISAIEGKNWRHGDIEDMLATVACLKGHKWKSMMIKVPVSRVARCAQLIRTSARVLWQLASGLFSGTRPWRSRTGSFSEYSQAVDVATLSKVQVCLFETPARRVPDC